MSKHMIELTSIEARLKHYGVQLIGKGPDDNEIIVQIPGQDIREQYGCNPAVFVDRYEDESQVLFDLFYSVSDIQLTD